MDNITEKIFTFKCTDDADLSNFWSFDYIGKLRFCRKIAETLRNQGLRVIEVLYDDEDEHKWIKGVFAANQLDFLNVEAIFTQTMQILCTFFEVDFRDERVHTWKNAPWYGYLQLTHEKLPFAWTADTIRKQIEACLNDQGLEVLITGWYPVSRTLVFSGSQVVSKETAEATFVGVWEALNEFLRFERYDFAM